MSQDDDTSAYNNTHRALLQALLARQTLTLDTAKPLLAAIESASTTRSIPAEDITQEDLDNYVDTLNAHISAFDFEVRYTLHQSTRERIYALVNTTSDALTQMSTSHSADEIAYVKRVLDCMFETNNTARAEVMAVTGMQALKLAKAPNAEIQRRQSGTQTNEQSQPPGNAASLTMSQAEKVLENMVAEGWFELSQRGFYSLTPRALMELRGWLQDTYNDPHADEEDDDDEQEEPHQKIKLCHACRDITTVGQRCPNLVCGARLHNHCVGKMFRARGGAEECPVCKTKWADAPPVGEKAAKRTGRETQGGGGSRGRVSNERSSAGRRRPEVTEVERESSDDPEGGASDRALLREGSE